MDYSRFLTPVSKNRKLSVICETSEISMRASDEVISFVGGLPNPSLFPFETADIHLSDGQTLKLNHNLMTTALQYCSTFGYEPLRKKLKEMTLKFHKPPIWEDREILVTTGAQEGLCKALEMIMNENDYFITHEHCYAGILAIINPLSPICFPVTCDEEGMIPESLKSVLSPWKNKTNEKKDEKYPKVIYINPNAANPTGISISTPRRRQIYEIAREYDLIILEDDPYYFLHFEGKKEYAPSFLSLDIDGRVIRFDSFSKIVSSGIRLGFITAHKTLINRIFLHKQVSNLQTSTLSQVLVSELLSMWGNEGFLNHIEKVKKFYKCQRDAMVKAAETYLKDLCTWTVPNGGMYLWIKVNNVKDTRDMILKRALYKNVLFIPGNAFETDSSKLSPYIRASFSIKNPEQINIGFQNLADLIREEIILHR